MRRNDLNRLLEERETDGTLLYNQSPLQISAVIDCVPPQSAAYIHPTGCLPLFDSPTDPKATHVANLVSGQHLVNSAEIPAVSQWGLIVMALLLLTAGTIVIRRLRAQRPTLSEA